MRRAIVLLIETKREREREPHHRRSITAREEEVQGRKKAQNA